MALVEGLKTLKHRVWLSARYANQVATAAQRHLSPSRIRLQRRVDEHMRETHRVTPRTLSDGVWGVCLMRNEAEILPAWLQHCERQGLDGLVIGNNRSTDDTSDIVKAYSGSLNIVLFEDTEPKHYHEYKMDHLARVARGLGAEWIVPMDADEFWYGAAGPLAHALRNSPRTVKIQQAKVHNAVRVDSGFQVGSRADRLPKVAFRWHPLAHLDHGNHAVARPGLTSCDLRILHFSYRSEAHFIAKVRHGAQALSYLDYDPSKPGHSWLDLNQFSDEQLKTVYAEMLEGRGPEFMDWIPLGDMLPVAPFPWESWQLD